MQKELTINVDERVYDELQRIGGPEDISQFIESLILPRLHGLDLDSAYQQMAEDKTREAEALEWAEAMIEDADDSGFDTECPANFQFVAGSKKQ